MRKGTLLVLAFATLIAAGVLVYAGEMEPSAPPSPTMKPLDVVEPRIPIRASDLPMTISQSGSYYLAEDVVTAGGGINIVASNVTLDLMGHSLVGGTGTGIHSHWDAVKNVTVRNGIVAGWSEYGIQLENWDWLVENIHAHDNGLSGFRLTSRGIISSSTASNNAGNGIFAMYANVIDCLAHDNASKGIWVDGGVVRGCTVRDNTAGGIDSNASVVTQSTASYNPQFGIRASGGTITDCQVDGEHTGILVDYRGTTVARNSIRASTGIDVTVDQCRIEGNHVTGGATGIKVSGVSNVIVRNTVIGAAGTGYDIVPGNDVGPIGTAATSTSPWANIE